MNLQKYLDQLHIDITTAIKNGVAVGVEDTINAINDGINLQEAPSSHPIPLEKWCGIK